MVIKKISYRVERNSDRLKFVLGCHEINIRRSRGYSSDLLSLRAHILVDYGTANPNVPGFWLWV